MRKLPPRATDVYDLSMALAASTAPGGIGAAILAANAAAMQRTGGVFTGPVTLNGNALTPLSPAPLQQVNALISAAIGTLVGTAPGTLDTLAEIAAALNNDASIVSGLTALINARASLTGATFTGPVQVPSNTTMANGVVTLANVQALIAAIPPSSTNTFGADFSVAGGGIVSLANTVAAGVYTKLTVNTRGIVTAGGVLVASDLPTVTPTAGAIFSGPTAIAAAFTAVQSAIATLSAAGVQNAIEDAWVSATGAATTFTFVNIPNTVVPIARRLLVFIDGLRQPYGSYTVSATALTFATAQPVGAEIEALLV